MIQFIKYKNIFFALIAVALVASVAAIAVYKLKPSIDFTGGSILELQYNGNLPTQQAVKDAIKDLGLKDVSMYTVGSNEISLRTENLTQDVHAKLLADLKKTGDFQEKSFEAIGPTVGAEIKNRTILLVAVSLLAMLIYIAIAFKNVPGPVSSWKYGLASFMVLSHDVLVTLGVLAVLGYLQGVQITIPVITALLTVIGYAINNVIVVYDRLRENLTRDRKADFGEIANRAVNQTLSRQINTSVATLLPVFAIYFLAGQTLKYFALTLILGVVAGTYSSIFLSSQILVVWMGFDKKRQGQNKAK